MRGHIVAVMLMLAGCAETLPLPPEGTPVIETYSGSGLYDSTQLRVFAGDMAELQYRAVGETEPKVTVFAAPEGTFAAVAAIVAEQGPAAAAGVVVSEFSCMDYGTDSVTARPAINGFEGVSVDCPDARVAALQRAILAVVPLPQ